MLRGKPVALHGDGESRWTVTQHVATNTLVRCRPEWEGPLLDDKGPSVIFDNAKVKSVVGDFECPLDPWDEMRPAARQHRRTQAFTTLHSTGCTTVSSPTRDDSARNRSNHGTRPRVVD